MKKILISMLGCCVVCSGHAASRNISILSSLGWLGNGDMLYCGKNEITDSCIGESAGDGCRAYGISAGKDKNTFGILMMMARKITAHGAMFCPTQIDASTSDSTSWTLYREPGGNNDCVWLCQDGWAGQNCATQADVFSGACDVIPFLRSNYDNATLHYGGENIEFDVPLFAVHAATCSSRMAEYDMALLVNRWLDSGNGAFVRKMVVRGRRESSDTNAQTTVMIYPASASTDILVCKNGYRANASKTDCEPIDATKCSQAIISSQMCSGWNLSAYKEDEHEYVFTGDCYKYGCKTAGYAFATKDSHTCSECVVDKRNGVNPVDGTCVRCAPGQIFNQNATTSGYCSVAVALTKTDLMYGRGKTKNSNPNVKNQCWTMTEAQAYRECVMNGGVVADDIKKREVIKLDIKEAVVAPKETVAVK